MATVTEAATEAAYRTEVHYIGCRVIDDLGPVLVTLDGFEYMRVDEDIGICDEEECNAPLIGSWWADVPGKGNLCARCHERWLNA